MNKCMNIYRNTQLLDGCLHSFVGIMYSCSLASWAAFMGGPGRYFSKNWIKSGIKYVCKLFDENWRFKSIECLSQMLYNRHNILCEYMILRNIFTKLQKYFNFSNAIHVNPKQKYVYIFQDWLKLIRGLKCKLFYGSLLFKAGPLLYKQPTNKLKIKILSETSIPYLIRHASFILIVGLHL